MNAIANNTNEVTAAMRGKWLQFHRFNGRSNFFGVVNKDGVWVDSSVTMNGAAWAAAMDAGIPNMDVPVSDMLTHINKLGYSIVHDSLLEKLFHAGVLK